MFNVTGIYVRWVAEWEHETHGREQQVWQTGIEYENEQDSDSEKVPGVSVTGAATYSEGEGEEQFKIAPAVKLMYWSTLFSW